MNDWKSILCLVCGFIVIFSSSYSIMDIILIIRNKKTRKLSERNMQLVCYKLTQKFVFMVGSALMVYGIVKKSPMLIEPFFYLLSLYTFALICYYIFKMFIFSFSFKQIFELTICDAAPYMGILWTMHGLYSDMMERLDKQE